MFAPLDIVILVVVMMPDVPFAAPVAACAVAKLSESMSVLNRSMAAFQTQFPLVALAAIQCT